jgi:hypothetical protein
MFEPRRQHPLAIVFNFGRQLKDLIIPLILFQVSTLSIGMETFGVYWIFAGVFMIFGFMLIGSVVSWYRFTYGVEDDELRRRHCEEGHQPVVLAIAQALGGETKLFQRVQADHHRHHAQR